MTTRPADPSKLDAYLEQAVIDQRQGLVRILITLSKRDGAEARVRAFLERIPRQVELVISDGQVLLTTAGFIELAELSKSDDVDRISFDAVVSI